MAVNNSNLSVIQVANFGTAVNKNATRIDVNAFKEIVKEHGLEDTPVVALAVAGSARTGKTFLLNAMVVYLEHMSNSAVDSFAASNVISGMKWAGGRDGVTKGMWLWKKPYKIKRKDGLKVAILLLDTQGIDDGLNGANPKIDHQIIFITLSMATIYIHNVQKEWRHSERKIYQIFSSFDDLYGDVVQNCETLFNSFTLLFRDWCNDTEFGHRIDIFREELEKCRRSEEAFTILNGIDKLFKNKTVWVLPEPSTALKSCQGSISVADIGSDFQSCIVRFFTALFSLDGIYNPHMESALTGNRFIELLEGLSGKLQEWPELAGEAEQLKDIYLSKAFGSAKEHFISLSKEVDTTDDIEAIKELLQNASYSACNNFKEHSQRIKPSDQLYYRYYGKLRKEIKQEEKACKSIAKLRTEQSRNKQHKKDKKQLEEKIDLEAQQHEKDKKQLEEIIDQQAQQHEKDKKQLEEIIDQQAQQHKKDKKQLEEMIDQQAQQHEQDKKQLEWIVKLQTRAAVVLASAVTGFAAGPFIIPTFAGVAGLGAAGMGAAGGTAMSLASVGVSVVAEKAIELVSKMKDYAGGNHSMKKNQ